LFEDARKNPLSVVFVDEVEALIPRRRSTQSSVMARVVPQFLAELEGFKSGNPILFVGATNEPWLIDPAMLRPGRFDEKIYVGLPDESARAKIFQLQLERRYTSDDVDYAELAHRTEGYSGADIRAICEHAAETVFLQAVQTGSERPISMKDLLTALQHTKPSVTPDLLKRYEAWRKVH
ncbi:MAG: ATP-binding protein, partial [Planctomycetota bacterium]